MKIVFIGTVRFSLKALQRLLALDANIVGVVTRNSSPSNADYAELAPICRASSIPVRYADQIPPAELNRWIRSLAPEVIFCFGWSHLLGPEVLGIPRIGVIGFHPAALPRNRGRHPIIWALALGLQKTASSFFFMDEGPDSGDLLSQQHLRIEYEDNAETLYQKIEHCALQQIEGFLPLLEFGSYKRIPQDHSQSNYWRKRTPEDGKIDFRMSSRGIFNLVRALTKPYVGAHVNYNGRPVKIWRIAEVCPAPKNIEPGKILSVGEKNILVKCGDHAALLCEHEFETLPKIGEYL